MAEYQIQLENLRFFAHHGVFEQEKTVGNEFIVDLSITIPAKEDYNQPLSLEDTISYADIYDIINQVMKSPEELLENVGRKISLKLINKWSVIKSGTVKITKVSPPIPGFSGRAAVMYKW